LPFVLRPQPQAGDTPGNTSQFVGELPEAVRGQKVEVTIPNIRIAGERFRVGFSSATHDGHAGMPTGVARGSAKERELYLTPGGIYTADDVQANGQTVPSIKFAGVSWPHDDDLRAGDKLCPVTSNKADARCSWVVNGETYEFCCPPCLDKFVGWAKTRPEKIRKPQAYVYAVE
jgi:hypothetical protein